MWVSARTCKTLFKKLIVEPIILHAAADSFVIFKSPPPPPLITYGHKQPRNKHHRVKYLLKCPHNNQTEAIDGKQKNFFLNIQNSKQKFVGC